MLRNSMVGYAWVKNSFDEQLIIPQSGIIQVIVNAIVELRRQAND